MNGNKLDTRVIQVTNICPNINGEQMRSFLQVIGRLEQFKLYPERVNLLTAGSLPNKVAYAKFAKAEDAAVALHLTNTVFIDRALILVPVDSGVIPDEAEAMQYAVVGNPGIYGSNNAGFSSSESGAQEQDSGEELSRTVYVENIPEEAVLQPELLISYFGQIGEVKYIRLAGEAMSVKSAVIEFSSQSSAESALAQSGVTWNGHELRISRSQNLIAKAQLKSSTAAQKEIEAAMEQVREADNLIKAHAATPLEAPPLPGSINKSAMRSVRSRSREASRSSKRRSPSPPRRKRSRTRSRSREKESRRRSRSRSRDRRRSRSRSRSRRKRSRSRSRSRGRDKDKKKKDRRSSEEKDRRKKGRETSEERDRKKKARETSEERKPSKRDVDKYSSDEGDRSPHKKKHKKEKKKKHRESSRSRSREREKTERGSKKNGEKNGSPVVEVEIKEEPAGADK